MTVLDTHLGLSDLLSDNKLKPWWDYIISLSLVVMFLCSTATLFYGSGTCISCYPQINGSRNNDSFNPQSFTPSKTKFVESVCRFKQGLVLLNISWIPALVIIMIYVANNFWLYVPAVGDAINRFVTICSLLSDVHHELPSLKKKVIALLETKSTNDHRKMVLNMRKMCMLISTFFNKDKRTSIKDPIDDYEEESKTHEVKKRKGKAFPSKSKQTNAGDKHELNTQRKKLDKSKYCLHSNATHTLTWWCFFQSLCLFLCSLSCLCATIYLIMLLWSLDVDFICADKKNFGTDIYNCVYRSFELIWLNAILFLIALFMQVFIALCSFLYFTNFRCGMSLCCTTRSNRKRKWFMCDLCILIVFAECYPQSRTLDNLRIVVNELYSDEWLEDALQNLPNALTEKDDGFLTWFYAIFPEKVKDIRKDEDKKRVRKLLQFGLNTPESAGLTTIARPYRINTSNSKPWK